MFKIVLAVATALVAALMAFSASTAKAGNGTYLCYSTFQDIPAVFAPDVAAKLLASTTDHYFLPFAVKGTVQWGTNVGGYHLTCSPSSTLTETGLHISSSGDATFGQVVHDAMTKVFGTDLGVFHVVG